MYSKNRYSARQYFAFITAVFVLTISATLIVSAISRNGNTQTADTAQTQAAPDKIDTVDTPDNVVNTPDTPNTSDTPDLPQTPTDPTEKISKTSGKNTSSAKEVEVSSTASVKESREAQTDTSSGTDVLKTKQPPIAVFLNVPFYSQTEEMPTGCELVSARMALEYLGVKISYDDILSHLNISYLQVDKKGRLYGKSPFEAFIGDPYESTGFGCYPTVIIDMVEDMSVEGLRAEDTSSLPLDFVAKTYLNLDIPVLVWVTIGMGDSYLTDTWYLTDENGKITEDEYTWRAAEHCMVLVGYDGDYYYFNDPLAGEGTVKCEKALVEERYNEIGCYSMILRND